ncbi:MAG: universal stress protein, partial [Alphaproteobacteria bacterium]|nr:universal stress protein [Alphaproteobacteria bacterium]
ASRAAARAVADAMPILTRAQTVTAVCAGPDGGGGCDALAVHLRSHGVAAEVRHAPSPDLTPGDILLDRAADMAADLIVMGAYGHARWSEVLLGGATRHVLTHMTVPVFLSH